MQIKQGNFCPLLQKECIGLQCAWITQIRGNEPQTGKEIDEWDCAVKWIPMLLIENSQQQRHTSAAVESFRNEVVENSVNPLTIMKTIAAQSQPFLEVTKQ
tara:strand:- start:332 stop:634 length:303 start_codon:yes stop_codon:yes gene_type:complete